MIGGAADLVESTKTEFEGGGLFSRRTGRAATSRSGSASTRWARSSTASACTAGCVKPYGSTFLIFSDYMRPAVRLSALMRAAGRLGVDARLGRARRGRADAPAGRALRGAARDPAPLVRAAGGRERDGRARGRSRSSARTARSRSRSRARRCRRSTAPSSRRRPALERGAYALWESGDAPDLILIATGSEVGLALEAGRRARGESGTAVRVVSMPCWELFEAQPADYRDEVLPPDVTARLSVEPGRRARLEALGRRPRATRSRSTASAPRRRATTVLERLGYNVDNVVARATALLERVS